MSTRKVNVPPRADGNRSPFLRAAAAMLAMSASGVLLRSQVSAWSRAADRKFSLKHPNLLAGQELHWAVHKQTCRKPVENHPTPPGTTSPPLTAPPLSTINSAELRHSQRLVRPSWCLFSSCRIFRQSPALPPRSRDAERRSLGGDKSVPQGKEKRCSACGLYIYCSYECARTAIKTLLGNAAV